MKNRKLLVPLCALLCGGLPVMAHADTPASNNVWTIPSATEHPQETAAWTTLLQAVNETLIDVWSLQQEKRINTVASAQLQTARIALETTRSLAQHQCEEAKIWSQTDVYRIQAARSAAQTAVDQLQNVQRTVSQIQAEPIWAAQLSDVVTTVTTASQSAQVLLNVFTLSLTHTRSMTDAEEEALYQKNKLAFAGYDQWRTKIEAQNAQDLQSLRANIQFLKDAEKKMRELQERFDAAEKSTEKILPHYF